MKIREVISFLEEEYPLQYAEDFDNVGVLVGNPDADLQGVLVTLDCLESVVDEAITKKCNLIVSFHPIIFSGLKKITGKTYVERVVMKAIQHNIVIYALHTAMDNAFTGVNATICDVLGLENRKILLPKANVIRKLITYVPENQAEILRNALFEAGAGAIGNYSQCSFNINGVGTFLGNEQSNPVVGQKEKLHFENETQIGVVFPQHLEQTILKTLFENHPYEEVAYEIYTINNIYQQIGLGMVGELPEPMSEISFLNLLKTKMNAQGIRHSALLGKSVQRIAVLGGSGAFAIDAAKRVKADVFVSADMKYHDFFKAENRILLADIGHYESEQYIKNHLFEKLTKKFPNFAPVLSVVNTNPINYL